MTIGKVTKVKLERMRAILQSTDSESDEYILGDEHIHGQKDGPDPRIEKHFGWQAGIFVPRK